MKRTEQQNKALHLAFRILADTLNEKGLEMKPVLAVKEIDVPWTETSVKEVLYRPIMIAMTQKGSTTELDRLEVSQVWDVLMRHLGEHFGINVPFPSEDEDE